MLWNKAPQVLTQTFNRTIVELKLTIKKAFTTWTESFNRTIVELKLN